MRSQATFVLLIFGGLIATSHQQGTSQNDRPYFLTNATNGVDGDLRIRLTDVGILESTEAGTVIGTLKCKDNNPLDTITYGVSSQTLRLNPNVPGQLILRRKLDKEAKLDDPKNPVSVPTVFYCWDNHGLTAEVPIKITITDVNDEKPVFQRVPYNTEVRENVPVDSEIFSDVYVRDRDLSANAQVDVSCYSNPTEPATVEACKFFRLTTEQQGNGRYRSRVFLKKQLDFEVVKSHTMSILAKDRGTPPLNSTVNLLVQVLDTQDSPPKFLHIPYSIYVNENEPVGNVVQLRASATDGDEGISRPMKIKIKEDKLGFFELGPTTQDPVVPRYYFATIIVKGLIDREQVAADNYVFQVEAIELENGVETNNTVVANVSVNIQDINDNKPVFDKNLYEVNLRESDQQQNNTQVANLDIWVRDIDDPSNAKFRIQIVNQSFPTFALVNENNITGSISAQLRIKNNKFTDYDVPQYRRQTVVLRAYDLQTNEGSTTTVIINLLDLNDNIPQFTQNVYSYSLAENANIGDYITTIMATDKDEGAFGQVVYTLNGTKSDSFKINMTSGVVTLAKPLDYETQRKYDIIVEARDGGNPARVNTTILTINVLNINDLPPVPDHKEYQTYALETSLILSPEVIIRARDTESPNSLLTFRIARGNSPNQAFAIGRTSGRLTLVDYVDYDATPAQTKGVFEVIVEISDNGNPAQTVEVKVRVTVQDENNNTPQFTATNYFANVSEIAQQGSLVIRVTATDADNGVNGQLRYSIQSGGRDDFTIGQTLGDIIVSNKSSLDYNANPRYNLIVFAVDRGSPPKTGSALVRINVLDANNKPPTFVQDIYVTSIREDQPIGTTLDVKIQASDVDSTASIMYSVQKSSVQVRNSRGQVIPTTAELRDTFQVDPVTGNLSTARNLSRERAAEISFNLLASDQNAENLGQTATTSVMVTILGATLSTIKFIPDRYYFTVLEGKQTGYVITTVLAKDPACPSCVITYQEVPDTDILNYLQVNRTTGQVSITQPLDYEVIKQRQLTFEVEARAQDGRTARVWVTVEVADDNDNSPYFEKTEYIFKLSEGYRYPFGLGYVQARDNDSLSFAEIVYSLSGQRSSDFMITRDGYLMIAPDAVIDYETTKQYNLLVIASDNPSNQTSTVRRQTSVIVKIDVLDVNDNAPKFRELFPFYAVENTNSGTRIGAVTATDADEGRNSIVRYYFTTDNEYFRITETGIIVTKQSLRDTSPLSPFILTVRAEDQGFPAQFSETNIQIIVRSGQLDDGKPRWSRPRPGERYSVEENTPRVQHVLMAVASTRNGNNQVYYSLNTDNKDYQMFKIDRLTGNLTTNGIFDREMKAVYELILVATDRTNDTLQTLRGVTVDVLDKNDSIPDFGKCPGVSLRVPQTTTVMEDTPVGTKVYQVKACDLDAIVNGVIYRAEQSNPMCVREMAGGFFNVTADGSIISNKVLDRETKPYHLVCVRAWQAPVRKKRQADGFNRAEMTNPGQIAYVVIKLADVDDQAPMFPNSVLYEAVASIPTESTVVRVEAIDLDLPPFNRVRYSIESIMYHEPNVPPVSLRGAFLIGSDTGIISVNFPSYSDFRIPKSYFELNIKAEDFSNPLLKDNMVLKVYIYEPAQTIRVVMNETPDTARGQAYTMIGELSKSMPGSIFKLQQISYHRVVDEYDVTKTDVCFIVISNDEVMSVGKGSSMINGQAKYTELLKSYGATSPGSCYKSRSSIDKINWTPLWWTLVALAIFIFICCCILIAAICILYRNYKNYMKTRKTYLVAQ